jgi:hypothetical protein
LTVIAATLLTDRKPVFPVSLEYLVKEPLIEKIYVNVQTQNLTDYLPIYNYLRDSGKPFNIDYWWVTSDWIQAPEYDQDSKRFMPIAMGRNMALDWAIVQCMLNQDTSHLLFVDSDVRPHRGGLQHLLDLQKPLTGGLVPGRGVHSSARYVFGVKEDNGTIVRCEHGTSGYLLIERNIFEVLRFRVGPSLRNRSDILCDDPAYSVDAQVYGYTDGWYIDRRASADHVDDPNHPLTADQAINGYHVGASSSGDRT